MVNFPRGKKACCGYFGEKYSTLIDILSFTDKNYLFCWHALRKEIVEMKVCVFQLQGHR